MQEFLQNGVEDDLRGMVYSKRKRESIKKLKDQISELEKRLEHNPDEPIRLDKGKSEKLLTKMKLAGVIAKKWQ